MSSPRESSRRRCAYQYLKLNILKATTERSGRQNIALS